MPLENMLLCTTVTIIDKETEEKAGQLKYIIRDSEVEIFDTYVFPEYRRQNIMSNLIKKIIPELKISGISKVRLKYFNEDARIAWESIGFSQIGKEGHMELDI